MNFWITLLATLIAGAVGGVVYELIILQGNIELPHRLTSKETITAASGSSVHAIQAYLYDMGILARIVIGALAAVATWLVVAPDPNDWYKLLATAVVAGSAGIAVFESVQTRFTASLAQQNAANAAASANKMADKVDAALQLINETKRAPALDPAAAQDFAGPRSAAVVGRENLDRIERLLSEAKGIHESI